MRFLILIFVLFMGCEDDPVSPEIEGCTDENACNYDETATADDGSCLENDCAGICGGGAKIEDCIIGTWLQRDEDYEYIDNQCSIIENETSPDFQCESNNEEGWYWTFDGNTLFTQNKDINDINCCDADSRSNIISEEYEVTDYTIENGYLIHALFKNEGFEINNGNDYLCESCDDNVDDCQVTNFEYCIDFSEGEDVLFSSYPVSINSNILTIKDNDDECYIYDKVEIFEIGGCMDNSYINYNPYATYSNGTCNNNTCPE